MDMDPSQKFGTQSQSQKFGTQQIQKIKFLKIKIRVAQHVGKVCISRKKILLASFGAIWAYFLRRPENMQKCCLFSLVGQWALFTRFGPMGLVGVPLPLLTFSPIGLNNYLEPHKLNHSSFGANRIRFDEKSLTFIGLIILIAAQKTPAV